MFDKSKLRIILAQEGLIAARMDTYKTKGGTEFKMSLQDFSRFLRDRLGVNPGSELGRYLREEDQVDDKWITLLSRDGAKVKRPRKPKRDSWEVWEEKREKEEARKQKVWDALLDAIWASLKGSGSDVGDFYLQMPPSMASQGTGIGVGDIEDLPNWLQSAAGDLGQSWEYALEGKAEKLYDQYEKLIGRVPRDKKEVLREVYSDAWYSEMMEGYKKLKRDKKELARLDAIRAQARW